ncbi:MAG: hypothetical protein ACI8Y4_004373 [Candidatus Poriferisodalaceae bacterium]|jgi:hypothetical protein
MTSVLAFAKQKGGVGKTTTVQSLGDALDATLHDVFLGRATAEEVLVEPAEGLAILPSSIDLAGAEVHLLTKTGREFVLARALEPMLDRYDFVLLDCGPSLGVLTINGLTAAQHVVIPCQHETLSHRGVGHLLETVRMCALSPIAISRSWAASPPCSMVTTSISSAHPSRSRSGSLKHRGQDGPCCLMLHRPSQPSHTADWQRQLRPARDHESRPARQTGVVFASRGGSRRPSQHRVARPRRHRRPLFRSRPFRSNQNETVVSALDAVARVSFFSVWVPFLSHDRWLTCPSCKSRSWFRLRLS